jgi:hypothetical protein
MSGTIQLRFKHHAGSYVVSVGLAYVPLVGLPLCAIGASVGDTDQVV